MNEQEIKEVLERENANRQEGAELLRLALPLIEWLNANQSPSDIIMITQKGVTIFEGKAGAFTL
jgi:hypothetical protein